MASKSAFVFTRVFRDNVCGTSKWYIIPSSFPQSLRNKNIISCCGKNYSPEYRFHLYGVSNVAPVIKHPVKFLSVPKYRIFFCDLTQEFKFPFVSHRLYDDPSVLLRMVTLCKHPGINTLGTELTNFTLLGFADHDVTAQASRCLAQENLSIKEK